MPRPIKPKADTKDKKKKQKKDDSPKVASAKKQGKKKETKKPTKPTKPVTKKTKKGKKSTEEPKKRRWKAGTVALREIRRLQKGSQLLIQRAPFQRLVRDRLKDFKSGLQFKPSALEAVQEAAENYMVGVFEGAVILQLHRQRKTLNQKDINYTRRIRGEWIATDDA